MSDTASPLREFIYLDADRVDSLAAQLGADLPPAADAAGTDRTRHERLFTFVEAALTARPDALRIDRGFDFGQWRPETFRDGQTVAATGVVRLLDFQWLTTALAGLPSVLKKMAKLEMEALRNSEEGRRMSKTAIQQRSHENQQAISQVEAFKADELGDVIRKLYGDVVRVKVQPSREQPACVLVGSAYSAYFTDTSAALSGKYGVEIDAGWTVVGQLNVPSPAPTQAPLPTGNKIEDAFEQIAVLMNNAFRLSNAPAFPLVSMTPIAIYRALG